MHTKMPSVFRQLNHRLVDYNDRVYAVVLYYYKDQPLLFVIDAEDLEKISNFSWHRASDDYVRTSSYKDEGGVRHDLYLHNLVTGRLTFDGKGQSETMDHINKCKRDNRKENLRLATQAAQNQNQQKKPRKVELPADCGFTAEEIPTNIHYIKANGNHRDGFGIEIKGYEDLDDNRFQLRIRSDDPLITKLRVMTAILKEVNASHPVISERLALLDVIGP